ncbi:hypothetical protein Poly30_37310 [Planctomycetes bacterium Poly30]|uniref:Carboxypeptidase regulatory-like domain-containing protein n=1 Tax=Saltatorellus ferox TaxID=2528018 RepID=A0A518EVS5_9BACT|nr:hypothetical protein Poly30_37310 [Planctomycetes bacterium Poly30]
MASLSYLLTAAALTSSLASADILIGRVTDTLGNPVPQTNLDVFDAATGNELTLTGDFTAPDGSFALVVPAGTYDVVALPPVPPTTTLVGQQVDNVVVAGTLNLGTIVLEPGVVLTGRALRPGGTPAVGADLEGRNLTTNRSVVLSVVKTDTNGFFSTTAPAGPFRLSIDPGIDLPLAAPTLLELDLGATTALGNIQLAAGHYLTVTALRPNGTPVVNADLDVLDSVTGVKLLTSNDNTNAAGVASFVVPTGTFDLEVCAPTAMRLVPQLLPGVVVNGPTNAGTVTVPSGAHLFGSVRNAAGSLVPDIDIDLFLPGTNTKVLTCDDDTNLAGQYRTTVPFGTFDVLFEDVRSDCPESVLVSNVTISADTNLDANMTGPGLGCRYCMPGIANSAGRAALMDASGSASVAQNNVTLIARDLPPLVFGFFLLSRNQGNVAQPGTSAGILCLSGSVGRYNRPNQIGQSGTAGIISIPIDLTQTPTPVGFISILPGETWNFQAWYRDNTAGGNSNFTTGLTIAFQ